MPKVQNLSGKGVPLLRWRVLPDNRLLDPLGKLREELPDDIGFSSQAKRLADLRVLKIEGYNWHPREAEEPAPVSDPSMPLTPEPEPDDLTELVHIGTGRARKLTEVGVTTFAGVVEIGDDLSSLLDISGEVAEEIVADATSKMG